MAAYDYRCSFCGMEFEFCHPMSESPIVLCPDCASESLKVPHIVGFSTRSVKTAEMKRALSQVQRNIEMKETLRTEVGIEKISPIGRQTMSDIYKDTMAQKSQIIENMAESREKSEKQTKTNQKEWTKGALSRLPKRRKEMSERKASEASKKRAINL